MKRSLLRVVLGRIWFIWGKLLAAFPGTSVFGKLWSKMGRMLGRMSLLALVLATVGCAGGGSVIPDSIPDVHGNIERTGAHIEVADDLVDAAKPESNSTGKSLLDAASEQHDAALESLDNARTELTEVKQERQELEQDSMATRTELTKVKSGWGYKLQVLVSSVFWILVGAQVLHFVLGGVALFVPGVGGGVLAKIAVMLNPFAWFQSARDNYWFRVQAQKPKYQ